MSSAFVALIWWVIPAAGLVGALGYVVWVTKFKDRFESETSRSIGKFAEFQSTFRDPNQIPKPNSPQFPTQAPQTPTPNEDRTPL